MVREDITERVRRVYCSAGISPNIAHTPGQTILDLFEHSVRRNPDRKCTVLCAGPFTVSLTNAQIDRAARCFAAGLLARNLVRPGDVVAVRLPNISQTIIAALAVWRLGGTVLFMFPRATPEDCSYKWADANVRLLITLDMFVEQDVAVLKSLGRAIPVVVTHGNDCFPFIPRLFAGVKLRLLGKWRSIASGNDLFVWQDIVRRQSPLRERRDRPKGIAVLLYTTGTTGGKPKAAIWEHEEYAIHALQMPTLFPAFKIGGEVVAAFAPYHHSFPATAALSLALATGTTIALVPNPIEEALAKDGKRSTTYKPLIDALIRLKPTILAGVPKLFKDLANDPNFSREAFESVRYCISGAARLATDVKNTFEAKTGLTIYEGYGLTEAFAVVTMRSEAIERARRGAGLDPSASVGVPIVGKEVFVCDSEERPLSPGATGEVCVRGAGMMRGYLNRPDETARAMRNGTLFTGDTGYIDECGCLHLTGRDKYLIKGNDGHNIDPEEVEAIVEMHPAVREAAVIKMPDPNRDVVPRAVVVLKEGVAPTKALAAEIITFCREKLDYKYPRRVDFADTIPRSPDGIKILRAQLEKIYSE